VAEEKIMQANNSSKAREPLNVALMEFVAVSNLMNAGLRAFYVGLDLGCVYPGNNFAAEVMCFGIQVANYFCPNNDDFMLLSYKSMRHQTCHSANGRGLNGWSEN
jgi:hypothetical protein